MTRSERQAIGKARLVRILTAQTVAGSRTLEQKISDAGPNPLRVDPHILTTARGALENDGTIIRINRGTSTWYALAATSMPEIEAKLQLLTPILNQLCDQAFNMRLGQSLEIAIFRALCDSQSLQFFGGFLDLEAHNDDQLYRKEEPPALISGRPLPGAKKFD